MKKKRYTRMRNVQPSFVQASAKKNELAPTGLAVEAQSSGYSQLGADRTRAIYKNLNAYSLSPYEDILVPRRELINRCRVLYMSAPIATAAINQRVSSVVGRGLRLHLQPDHARLGKDEAWARAWARKVEEEFDLWASDKFQADVAGINNFYELTAQAYCSMLQSGDCFVVFRQGETSKLRPYSTRLQIVEADRVATPTNTTDGKSFVAFSANVYCLNDEHTGNKVFDGVEVNKSGRVVAYHIADCYPTAGIAFKFERIETLGRTTGRPNILHLMATERPEQLRGVPMLSKVIEPILQLSRYFNNEVQAALLETYFTIYVRTPESSNPLFNAKPYSADGEEVDDDEEEDDDERAKELEPFPGVVRILRAGEEIKSVQPTRPNSQFGAFSEMNVAFIGASLQISKENLLRVFNSSYSASRAALQCDWQKSMEERELVKMDFCTPVFLEWFCEAVSRGRIEAPGLFNDPAIFRAYTRHNWTGSTMPQLDPVKEATAATLWIDAGLMTRAEAAARHFGTDFETIVDKLTDENAKLAVAKAPLEGMKSKAQSIISRNKR